MATAKDDEEIAARKRALEEIIAEVKRKYEESRYNPISIELIGKVFKISSYADIENLEFELRFF